MNSTAVGISAVSSFTSLTGGATEPFSPHTHSHSHTHTHTHTHTLQDSQKINKSEDNTGLFLAPQEE